MLDSTELIRDFSLRQSSAPLAAISPIPENTVWFSL